MSPADAKPAPRYVYRRQGRSLTTALVVGAFYLALCLAIVMVDAAVWLMGLLALFALPAIYDLTRNPAAGLTLDGQGIHWFTGRRHADVSWDEVDRIRLDTRLDFSVRASVVLDGGHKIRLPYEVTPPHKDFEAALIARGLKVERHHFSLIG